MHAPECRELLQCLTLQDPACRAAMEWLGSLAQVAVDDSIAGLALELAEQLLWSRWSRAETGHSTEA